MHIGLMKGIVLAAATALASGAAQAQSKAPAQGQAPAQAPAQAQGADDLAAAARKAGNLTKFMAAVGSAGLEAALNKGKGTIFAPSDAAFDKLPKALPGLAAQAAALPGDGRADIVNALLALGYNEKEALGAVKQLPDGVGVSDGIRQALKGLSKA